MVADHLDDRRERKREEVYFIKTTILLPIMSSMNFAAHRKTSMRDSMVLDQIAIQSVIYVPYRNRLCGQNTYFHRVSSMNFAAHHKTSRSDSMVFDQIAIQSVINVPYPNRVSGQHTYFH